MFLKVAQVICLDSVFLLFVWSSILSLSSSILFKNSTGSKLPSFLIFEIFLSAASSPSPSNDDNMSSKVLTTSLPSLSIAKLYSLLLSNCFLSKVSKLNTFSPFMTSWGFVSPKLFSSSSVLSSTLVIPSPIAVLMIDNIPLLFSSTVSFSIVLMSLFVPNTSNRCLSPV